MRKRKRKLNSGKELLKGIVLNATEIIWEREKEKWFRGRVWKTTRKACQRKKFSGGLGSTMMNIS